MEHDFISRSEAKARGLTHYYTGQHCKRGHIDKRNTGDGSCAACRRGEPSVAKQPPAERKLKNDIDWTDNIRDVLIDEYINTGDLHGAREAVNVSAAAYYRELEANPVFAEAIKKATVLAVQTFEDRAIHLAKKGNDKLILAVLKAKLGDQYTDRVKVDNTYSDLAKLSDEELDRRIAKLDGRSHAGRENRNPQAEGRETEKGSQKPH